MSVFKKRKPQPFKFNNLTLRSGRTMPKSSTTWKPGQSGNPDGRGKDKLFRQALVMELKEAGEDLPELREIARELIDVAKSPGHDDWTFAVREIIDRMDGKAPVMVTSDAEEFRKAVDMTDEELDAAIQRTQSLIRAAEREATKKQSASKPH
jgi:hypothetical protein